MPGSSLEELWVACNEERAWRQAVTVPWESGDSLVCWDSCLIAPPVSVLFGLWVAYFLIPTLIVLNTFNHDAAETCSPAVCRLRDFHQGAHLGDHHLDHDAEDHSISKVETLFSTVNR